MPTRSYIIKSRFLPRMNEEDLCVLNNFHFNDRNLFDSISQQEYAEEEEANVASNSNHWAKTVSSNSPGFSQGPTILVVPHSLHEKRKPPL